VGPWLHPLEGHKMPPRQTPSPPPADMAVRAVCGAGIGWGRQGALHALAVCEDLENGGDVVLTG
jgi:hypothetical protein